VRAQLFHRHPGRPSGLRRRLSVSFGGRPSYSVNAGEHPQFGASHPGSGVCRAFMGEDRARPVCSPNTSTRQESHA
jgi:hypothetical protein